MEAALTNLYLFTRFCFKNGFELYTVPLLPRSPIQIQAEFCGCDILNPHTVILKMCIIDS